MSEQTAADALAMPPNHVRQAGYKWRLLLEEALALPETEIRNGDVWVQQIITYCIFADMADALLGSIEWGFSRNIGNKMVQRLEDSKEPWCKDLAETYRAMGEGRLITSEESILRRIEVIGLAFRILAPFRNTLSTDEKRYAKLLSEIIRAINEHRRLRTGKRYWSDEVMALLPS